MRSMPSGRAPARRPLSSSSLTTRAVTTGPSLRASGGRMREDAGVRPSKPDPKRRGPSNVARAFDEHARSYDRLVGANRGYHEHLRMTARRMGLRDRGAGLRLLDLGCGTGASTQALLDVAPEAQITAVDASSEML